LSPRSYRVLIRPEAEEEVREAASWYEAQERGLGRDFLRAFRASTASLRRNPHQYQVVLEQVRRVLLHRFPYSVFYEVHEPTVVILACLHEARDPDEWRERVGRR
jgi:plasmid stabilization system protein ParE